MRESVCKGDFDDILYYHHTEQYYLYDVVRLSHNILILFVCVKRSVSQSVLGLNDEHSDEYV